MITRTIFSGFGGQGVLLMGYVLCHGAMHKGLNVTYFPSYGAEMRGGTANCTVTLSDTKIASPVASKPDILVAMNYPSLEKFESTVVEGGTVFLNSSLFKERPSRNDIDVIPVPIKALAREAGSERGENMVMIGTVCARAGLLSLDETIRGMEAALKGKEKFFPLNQKAIERGFAFAADGK
ncbi:MAG: 2-oxoacid:acceptor oxidoreductase family protein [Deltaproteobacteria bacterium]|nr:2-oxoacid:acceptor oxidoreductase family protein [Deltaproteobacteria bacterium]MBW2049922.1 2-oxoacid:acceptor oxidoreductase family protein [Deltaproteobacteria bacterium]MBW2112498.1 2-oxoacid:acceptor oxidoreductase family protein [Deltaproteobacteria bacterium]MBW2353868.1 2-oxoacid:acceptor oxidoreductase family protein [Deltaproteobacteria bacterium]